MPSLVFFERDERVRLSLVRLLSSTMPEISPIGQAVDGEQLLRLCRTGPWDVTIVDLGALTASTLDLLSRLRRARPHLPVVAICFSLVRYRLAFLLGLGVGGLVAPEDLSHELATAIRAALNGEQYLSQAVQQALANDARA